MGTVLHQSGKESDPLKTGLQKLKKNLANNSSSNIVFKIPVIRTRPDIYSTIVAVIQDEMKSGKVPEEPGKVEEDDPAEDEEEEDCLRIIEETAVDPKSLPGKGNPKNWEK